jgi:hypothetical protein
VTGRALRLGLRPAESRRALGRLRPRPGVISLTGRKLFRVAAASSKAELISAKSSRAVIRSIGSSTPVVRQFHHMGNPCGVEEGRWPWAVRTGSRPNASRRAAELLHLRFDLRDLPDDLRFVLSRRRAELGLQLGELLG